MGKGHNRQNGISKSLNKHKTCITKQLTYYNNLS